MTKRWLFLGLILLVFATGAVHTWSAVGPKTDALWLHYIGYRWMEPERAIAAESASRLADSYGDLEMARREVVFRNYPIAAVTQYVFHAIPSLPLAIGLGLYLQYVIAVGLFIFGIARLRDRIPIALTLSVIALTALLPGPKPTDHLLLYNGFDAVANFIAVIVAPGEVFNPMSPWPKNIVLLLALAAFALRWEGKQRIAYGLCVAMVAFHVSLGLIVLSSMIAIDIFWRIFPSFKGRDQEALLAVAGYTFAGVVCVALYVVADPQMPWDVPSAFVQLASRLFVLASLIALLWWGTRISAWLQFRSGPSASTIAAFVVLVTAFLMSYAAAGGLWERSKVISAGYSALANPTTQLTHDIERVYFDILMNLKRAR